MAELQRDPSGLRGSEVHVRTVRVDYEPARTTAFETLLSSDELARAARLRFAHLRTEFITAHGALRILLGRYLGIAPARLVFQSSENGKPSLVDHAGLRFNISHSGGLAVFACASDCEVGIDVEEIRPVSNFSGIATTSFNPGEASDLLLLPEEQRLAAFFVCWTRKEAFLKAIGEGLNVPLNSFQVTLQPGTPARLLHVSNDHGDPGEWHLHDLPIATGYASALAYRSEARKTVLFSPASSSELLSASA
jgi:4'-phosphopantetheinyl transferase